MTADEGIMLRFYDGGKLIAIGDIEMGIAILFHPDYVQLQQDLKRAVLKNELQVFYT